MSKRDGGEHDTILAAEVDKMKLEPAAASTTTCMGTMDDDIMSRILAQNAEKDQEEEALRCFITSPPSAARRFTSA